MNPTELETFYPMQDSNEPDFHNAVAETLHATGFDPTDRPSLQGSPVDMVILTGRSWASGSETGDMVAAFQDWADWRTKTGIPTVVRSLGWIRENYHGSDDQEKIRVFLENAYSLWGTDFVILGGDVEVIPSRTSLYDFIPGNGQDPSSDWYYAGLDSDWDQDDDGFYSWTTNVDLYPELWVGRIPARDSVEVSEFLTKLKTYERIPNLNLDLPPDSYYTKAVLAAGLTAYGGWDNTPPSGDGKHWGNGIYMAEYIKTAILDSVDIPFSTVRLFPELGTTANCGGGATVECYEDIKEGLEQYPYTDPVFTAGAVRDELQANAAIFYHHEHSGTHGLGGPAGSNSVKPIWDDCYDGDMPPSCTIDGCLSWIDLCFADYKSKITSGGLTRELLATLSNGPSYFVGASTGCSVGRLDQDSVLETLLRDPDGGAVSMWGGSSSTGWNANDDDQEPIPPNYFNYILNEHLPTGVGLYNAILDNDVPGFTNYFARHFLHLFGDPSMMVCSAIPEELTITKNQLCFPPFPGVQRLEVTVKVGSDPKENARVCLTKGDDVYALGWTDENGLVVFPAVFYPDVSGTGEKLYIWATAPNCLPNRIFIDPNMGATPPPPTFDRPVVYNFHIFSDSADSSTMCDFLEPGDLVDLRVNLINHNDKSAAPAGVARLGISPRVKASFLIDGVYQPDSIIIGASRHHPPTGIDTFSLKINEYAIRPEVEPSIGPAGVFFVWRDEDFVYHLTTQYDAADDGVSFSGVFITDGGFHDIETSIESTDTVKVTQGSVDKLEISLTGDSTDDEISFCASAQDWIELIDDSDSYSSIPKEDTTSVDFQFRIKSGMPPEWRLNMTVSAGPEGGPRPPAFSDFYTTIHSPELVLNRVEIDSLDALWECYNGDHFGVRPRLWNCGEAATDDILLTLVASGANVDVNKDTLWIDLEVGEEDWTHGEFLLCDADGTFRIESLTATREINGEMDTLGIWEDLNPWPRPDEQLEVPDINVEAMEGGLRLIWDEAPDSSNILGYYVYRNSSSIEHRVTPDLLTDSRLIQLSDLDCEDGEGDLIPYIYGISAVTGGLYEGPIVWTGSEYASYKDRSGWPIRVPKGIITSVVLANIDESDDLEIIVGGRVISAWKNDGTPKVSADGTLYDPTPDDGEFDQPNFEFHGDLAAGDLDGDGDIEIVGCYGDDSLLVVESDGDLLWSANIHARSTPTLADLDDDGKLEVILNACTGGSLYVFRHDGESYREGSAPGLFANPWLGEQDYNYNSGNYAGVAVADIHGDDSPEIIQPLPSGYIYAWKPDTTSWPGNPDSAWAIQANYPRPYNRVSTPTIGDIDGDGDPDIIVQIEGITYSVQAREGATGAINSPWDFAWFPTGIDTLIPFERPSQVSLADLGGNADTLEVVITRQADTTGVSTYDPVTKVSLLYSYNGIARVTTCLDSIPIPGRRKIHTSYTLGSPILSDIDNDGNTEILAPSNQGGLFCWEVRWNSTSKCFECEPEKGWPIVFPETPGTPVIADLDNDGYLEMVVPVGDYIHVYDLPGVSGDAFWATAAFDPQRTGNIESGVSYKIAPPDSPTDDELTGKDPAFLPSGPNPFRPTKVLNFRVPFRSRVSLDIYDIGGRKVRSLENRILQPGIYSAPWDGQSDGGQKVPNGIYFVRFKVGQFELTKKLVMIR